MKETHCLRTRTSLFNLGGDISLKISRPESIPALFKVRVNMVRLTHLACFIVSIGFLAACENTTHFSNKHPQLVAEPDKVSAMLADAADKASNALQTLAAVENSRTPAPDVNPVGNAPAELRRAITVNWVGPVEPITKTLADRAGYSFAVIGSPPNIPVVVSLDIENRPVIDVLRDLGLQLGGRGDIKVDASRGIIEVHYPPNTGLGG